MKAKTAPAQWEDMVVRQPAQPPQRRSPDQLQASYLTHELRAPVTAIRLGLEILQEQVARKLDADEKQTLSLAIKNTARLEGLINDIMDYSKIMAGKMTIEKEPCEARTLVNEAVDAMRAVALRKGVRLVKEVEEALPRVSAEPRRVAQILTNLISNAIKFTPSRGTVSVSVRAGRFDHAGTLVFRVKDTGCGIPPEDIDRVFAMFAQSAATGKKGCAGTGLGLTLARCMVELHGGRIWAESWKGAGANFYFTIPIAAEDAPRRVEPYPTPIEYHGLLVDVYRRINAFLAMFV
ncbi:MAG: HAMP domain-containing sensor histidine kinase [Elusimicrobia bacterium]|nr:HAMP domain-containing sensor histidine kinase [Elusimicrobiota bacterium]